MYTIDTTKQFEKSLKKCIKRGFDTSKLKVVLNILAETGTLPVQYRPHKLSGKYSRLWECHIEPDWLLLWSQNNTELTLLLMDTGTHSDIFK